MPRPPLPCETPKNHLDMDNKEKLARILLADANEAGDRAVEQYRARKEENAIRGRISVLSADSQERADFIVLLTMIDRLREAVPQWLEPNSGPRSTWEGDTQVVHPALVARTDAEAPELAYYCDIDEDWLSFKNGERVRLYDVEAWMPLPALPDA